MRHLAEKEVQRHASSICEEKPQAFGWRGRPGVIPVGTAHQQSGRRWTDREIDQITRLIADDLSAGMIAEKLGETRNAVIGIIHRKKLKLHRASGGGGHPRQKKEVDVKQSRIPGVLAPEPTKPSGPKPPAEPPPEAHPQKMRRVPLGDLDSHQCKWPVEYDPTVIGHHLFCGRPTMIERSYCDTHGGRAAAQQRAGEG